MSDPNALAGVVLAWLAALTLVAGAGSAVALKAIQNARDIRAAWALLRAHDVVIKNGHDKAPEKDGEP